MSLITSVKQAEELLRQAETTAKTAKSASSSSSGFQNILREGLNAVSEDMDAIFEEAAKIYDLPSKLIKAVAKAESNFNPKAVSRAGAIGVMQLMPATAKSLGVSDPYDARQNIMGGAKYLKENLERFGGNISNTLAAYNAGPNSVKKYGGIPPYKETQNYVKKVLSYMDGAPVNANKTVATGGGNQKRVTGAAAANLSAGGSLSGNNLASYGVTGGNFSGNSLASYGVTGGNFSGGGLTSSGLTENLLSNASFSGDGDTVTLDKATFTNLVQILRMQMMMNASREAGDVFL